MQVEKDCWNIKGGVFVIYRCLTDYFKLSGLKQYLPISSVSVIQESGTFQLGPLFRGLKSRFWLLNLEAWLGKDPSPSSFKLLVVAGQRSWLSCCLSAEDHCQLLEATHSQVLALCPLHFSGGDPASRGIPLTLNLSDFSFCHEEKCLCFLKGSCDSFRLAWTIFLSY